MPCIYPWEPHQSDSVRGDVLDWMISRYEACGRNGLASLVV